MLLRNQLYAINVFCNLVVFHHHIFSTNLVGVLLLVVAKRENQNRAVRPRLMRPRAGSAGIQHRRTPRKMHFCCPVFFWWFSTVAMCTECPIGDKSSLAMFAAGEKRIPAEEIHCNSVWRDLFWGWRYGWAATLSRIRQIPGLFWWRDVWIFHKPVLGCTEAVFCK